MSAQCEAKRVIRIGNGHGVVVRCERSADHLEADRLAPATRKKPPPMVLAVPFGEVRHKWERLIWTDGPDAGAA